MSVLSSPSVYMQQLQTCSVTDMPRLIWTLKKLSESSLYTGYNKYGNNPRTQKGFRLCGNVTGELANYLDTLAYLNVSADDMQKVLEFTIVALPKITFSMETLVQAEMAVGRIKLIHDRYIKKPDASVFTAVAAEAIQNGVVPKPEGIDPQYAEALAAFKANYAAKQELKRPYLSDEEKDKILNAVEGVDLSDPDDRM